MREQKVIEDIRGLSDGTIAALTNLIDCADIDKLREAVVRHGEQLLDLGAIEADEKWQVVWNNFKSWFDVVRWLYEEDLRREKTLVDEAGRAVPPGLCSAP